MDRRSLLGGSLAAAALVASPGLARALCASQRPQLGLRGAIGATRSRHAGLVVTREPTTHVPVPDLAAVRWVGPGQTPFAFDVEEVCEDVFALRPTSVLPAGRHTLRGVGREPIVVELVDTPLTPLAAPRVRSLRRTHRQAASSAGVGGRASEEDAQLTLELAAPAAGTASWAGALALAAWTERDEEVSTWGVITSTAPHPTAMLAWSGHCAGHGRFPPAGARVHVRVLDLSAQISPASPPVTFAR